MAIKKTIFIGPISKGRVPNDGASIKNFHILKRLRNYIPNLMEIDTDGWKKRPWILIAILLVILKNRNASYILSLNNDSANKLIRILHKLAPDASVVYWVIGGSIGKWMLEGSISVADYAWLTNIIVEGESMKKDISSAGLLNVSVMPNFKEFVKVHVKKPNTNKNLRFVFLSRINKFKGCDLILDAVARINVKCGEDRFSVDFYGPIEPEYQSEFLEKVSSLNNVSYNGFLDLRNKDNYKVLSGYDAMLFPTFWHGEGCPGIVIDAYMCGLPILASDWNLNRDYIIDNETGILFEAKSVDKLVDVMVNCINGKYDLDHMAVNALETSKKYDIDTVLSISNLKKNHIIDA